MSKKLPKALASKNEHQKRCQPDPKTRKVQAIWRARGQQLADLFSGYGLKLGQDPDPDSLKQTVFDVGTGIHVPDFDGHLNTYFDRGGDPKEVLREALARLAKLGVDDAKSRGPESFLSVVASRPTIKAQIELCQNLYLSLNRDALQLAMHVHKLKCLAEKEAKRKLSYRHLKTLLQLDKSDKRIGHYITVGEYFAGVKLEGGKFDQYLEAVRLNRKAVKALPAPKLAEAVATNFDTLPQVLNVEKETAKSRPGKSAPDEYNDAKEQFLNALENLIRTAPDVGVAIRDARKFIQNRITPRAA